MAGFADPWDRGARGFRSLVVTALLVFCGMIVVLLSGLPHDVRRLVTLLTLIGTGAVASEGFRRRTARSVGRRRLGYVCFTTGAVLATLSNVLNLVLPRSGAGQVAPGDVVLTVALAAGVVGLFFYPSAKRRATDLTRMVLDGIVIGGSILLVASVTLFPDVFGDAHRWPLLLTPVTDVVVATLATLLFLRGSSRDRLLLGLMAASFFCFGFSDFGFAFISASDQTFSYGSILDAGWIAGFLLLSIAVWAPVAASPAPDVTLGESSPVAGTVAMFTLFLSAFGVALAEFASGGASSASVTMLLVVVLAVLARQILLVVDNDQLRLTLEQRVQERTRSLRQVTARTDLLVNAVGEGIYGVDAAGLVTFVNPATALALGYAPDELIGREAHATFHARPADLSLLARTECYVDEAIRERRVTSAVDDTYIRADGEALPVEVTATPLIEDDISVGAVVIFRDVTQRREVDRLKTEFVSMVSHELRTPLTAIQGSLGLISGGALGPLPPAAGRMLEIASTSSRRLTRLINDILDVERIESGVLVLEPGRHQARQVTEAAVEQVGVLAAEANVSVEVGAVDGTFLADADRVVQTLINLIGNALKFSYPGGRVWVTARPDGDVVELTVRDEGRGIPPDRLDTIFARFEQVDSSDARDKGGFGLGLAISKSIVDRSGGRIWALNNAGGGATFRFTLPRADPADDTHDDTARPTGEVAASA